MPQIAHHVTHIFLSHAQLHYYYYRSILSFSTDEVDLPEDVEPILSQPIFTKYKPNERPTEGNYL